MPRERPSRAVGYALAAAGLFGVSTPLAKLLLGDVPPVLLAGLLYAGSWAGLTLWRLARRARLRSPLVREALRLLRERDEARAHLRADVQAGFDQLARGEGRVYDKVSGRRLAARAKAKGRAARPRKT